MIIGFTGTRKGMSLAQIVRLTYRLSLVGITNNINTAMGKGSVKVSFMHGDCKGSDEQFHQIVKMLFKKPKIIIHPPSESKHRAYCKSDNVCKPMPYLHRDRTIAATCDILIAAPKTDEEETRSGTWATVRYGRKYKKGIIILKR